MVGVDSYDQTVFNYTPSRITDRWPIRIIESCIAFGLTNARAAYCVKNNINFKTYSMKQFFLDILRINYRPVFRISKIKLEFKAPFAKYKRCVWNKCKKTTKMICHNEKCDKLACPDHSVELCCECYNLNDKEIKLTRDGVTNRTKVCAIQSFCIVKSRIFCANKKCSRTACKNHRHPLCRDFASMHLASNNTNYSVAVNPPKKFK